MQFFAYKPFVCKICKINYKTEQNLKIHLQSKTHFVREKENPPYKIEGSTKSPFFHSMSP